MYIGNFVSAILKLISQRYKLYLLLEGEGGGMTRELVEITSHKSKWFTAPSVGFITSQLWKPLTAFVFENPHLDARLDEDSARIIWVIPLWKRYGSLVPNFYFCQPEVVKRNISLIITNVQKIIPLVDFVGRIFYLTYQ